MTPPDARAVGRGWERIARLIEVQRSETIRCRPEEWLGLVPDVQRYATVDDERDPAAQ